MSEARICKTCNVLKESTAYRPKNKCECYECEKHRAREWKRQNKERTLEYTRQWKLANKEHVSAYNSMYDKANRETINKRSTAYHNMRAKTDANFKLAKSLRNRVYNVLKKRIYCKSESTLALLGCSIEFFRNWLSFCFEEGMTFENHGSVWHIDHTIPVSKFKLILPDEQKKCFHWSNMKPMYARDNLSKNCHATHDEIENHEVNITKFLESIKEKSNCVYTMIEIDRYSYIN